MEFLIFMFLIFLTIFVIIAYNKYNPKIDIVVSNRKYIILLWYNKYDWGGKVRRVYKKICEL